MHCGDVVLCGNKVGVIVADKNDYSVALNDGTTVGYNASECQKILDAVQVIGQFREKLCSLVQ